MLDNFVFKEAISQTLLIYFGDTFGDFSHTTCSSVLGQLPEKNLDFFTEIVSKKLKV